MFKTMEHFNIGANFITITWIKLFISNFLVCTQNAGYTSNFFCKQWGVNQGCNISPFCANFCMELIMHLIKKNPKIKGVTLCDSMRNETTFLISQFVDDTILFLSFTEECLCVTVNTLTQIEVNTGLKISYKKSTVYHISSLKHSNACIYTIKPLNWSDDDLDILGIRVANAPVQSNTSFEDTTNKMQAVVNLWHNHQLTLMSKIILINTLMSSLFIYKMSVLPSMSKLQLPKIDQLMK